MGKEISYNFQKLAKDYILRQFVKWSSQNLDGVYVE